MDEGYYTTGEFAKLCGVKKQTLFHYDDIGLLEPALVKNNGYRYYSYAQYEDFLIIACLKEAGMSLKDIASYLQLADEHDRADVLAACISHLEQRIAYLGRVKHVLEGSFGLAEHDEAVQAQLRDTTLVVREARRMLASPRLDCLDDQQLVEAVAGIVKAAEPSCVCLPSASVLAGDLDTHSHLLIEPDALHSGHKARELGLVEFTVPAGRYACIELYPDEDPQPVYARLIEDVRLLHATFGPYFYEEFDDAAAEKRCTTLSVQLLP